MKSKSVARGLGEEGEVGGCVNCCDSSMFPFLSSIIEFEIFSGIILLYNKNRRATQKGVCFRLTPTKEFLL